MSRVLEAVGGGGSIDVVRATDEDEEAAKRRLISVGSVPQSFNLLSDV